jgi:AraC family transcriptional regulator
MRRGRDKRELIERVKAYVTRSDYGRVDVTAIARAAGVSPGYLAEAFRAAESLSLYQYALQSRLQRAAARLAGSDDLTQLALELGFTSHSHFSAAFARWAGCPPSAYRSWMRGRQACGLQWLWQLT